MQPNFSVSAPTLARHRRAIALVLVLSFLVIISGLVIAFFSMVTSEASSAGNAAASASARSLADSAVSFVMGTIVDATQGHEPPDPTDPSKKTPAGPANAWVWASQPGMIRTYDNAGALRYVYKLYSADDMRLAKDKFDPIHTDTSQITGVDWATGAQRDVWVDMNEPLKDAANFDTYPIVDPTAADDFVDGQFPGHKDRNADHKVAGFHVVTDKKADPNAPTPDRRNNNPAPMPVKWLYVLQDGTMATATAGPGGAVLNTGKATKDKDNPIKDNPIKGRIAFWTDDECSKVNINTASQGTYWDTPRVFTPEDVGTLASSAPTTSPTVQAPGLAVTQPAKGEYQRYAGHPATTSLSPIFGYGANPVLPVPSNDPAAAAAYNANENKTLEKYYTLTPRISAGLSYGGTKIPAGSLTTTSTTPGQYSRLYASLDELLFNSVDPTMVAGSDTIHRVPNVLDPASSGASGRSLITPDMMQKARFFLTGDSRAPEVTAYGTPRVSMWPINDTNQTNPITGLPMRLTAYDQLAKFCATVGNSQGNKTATQNTKGYPFYFTRWNPRSTTADFADLNNVALYKYLRTLTSLPVPGNPYGSKATFLGKYGPGPNGATDRDQILTCIYDYVRCTNIQDSTPDPNNPNSFPYLYTPIDSIGASNSNGTVNNDPAAGSGEVVPIRIDNTNFGGTGVTQGFGRFTTVGSAYLLFFAAHGVKYVPDPNKPNQPAAFGTAPAKITLPPSSSVYPTVYFPTNVPNGQANGSDGIANQGATDALGVVFMISFNTPAQGLVGNHPKMSYRVQGLDQLVFTPGPYTSASGAKIAAGPFQGTGSPTAGGAETVADTSPRPVLPKDGINIIATSDVRTWNGRGIGGTASPVLGFSRGLFGVPDPKSVNPGQPKQCLMNGTKMSAEYNYPFFGYTDRLKIPDGNDPSKSGYDYTKTPLYYPTTFTVTQNGPIRVDLFATDYSPSGDTDKDKNVQTIYLQYPTGRFRMPYAVDTSNPAGPDMFSYPYLNSAFAYDGKTGGGAGKFGFNVRLQSGDANAAGKGLGGSAKNPGGSDNFILKYDTVIALEPAGTKYFGQTGSGSADYPAQIDHTAGDQRMYAALPSVPMGYFQSDWLYAYGDPQKNPGAAAETSGQIPEFAYNMMREPGVPGVDGPGPYHGVNGIFAAPGAGQYNLGSYIATTATPSRYPDVPRRVGGAQSAGGSPNTAGYVARQDGGPGSWDTGIGLHKDGAYINKPDEGDQSYISHDPVSGETRSRRPYMDKEDYFRNSGSFFSPNRQVPSAMMLGSIPTGIQRRLPWQTLLFHPAGKEPDKSLNPGTNLHPPADHYLADLFWIPVVEPYAISQPFSTAGKINLNYQIEPFTYIHRDTGMRALLTSTKLMAIPGDSTAVSKYKPFGSGDNPTVMPTSTTYNVTTRFPLNLDATMTMFGKRFDTDHDLYRSATEVSEILLIPNDSNLKLNSPETYDSLTAKMDDYWGLGTVANSPGHQLTGNNLRNKPYADVYGRLTTKSNVFTVHIRAQALRKVTGTAPNIWVTGQDQVVGEYRGSSIIERYIDANDPALPDFAGRTIADPTDAKLNIDQYYKFRVVSTKRFSP